MQIIGYGVRSQGVVSYSFALWVVVDLKRLKKLWATPFLFELKTTTKMKQFIAIGILCLLWGCSSAPQPIKINTDSIAQVKSIDSLSRVLNAVNFRNFYYNHYSVQFDTILNKRVFLSSYKISDIKKDSSNYLITLRCRDRYIIYLRSDSSSILNKILHGDKPPIVFSINQIKRANITSDDILFTANATLDN